VIAAALTSAKSEDLRTLVLTFHPHPAQVLGKSTRPPLTAIERKVTLLRRSSPDLEVVVEPFTRELSEVSAEDFVREILLQRLGARSVIVGDNFRFGHGRAGDLALLERLGSELGFEARSQRLVGDEAGPFSSTRVRDALAAGDLERVEHCLGRPHSFAGRVARGDARGRQIGFPTANLVDIAELIPADGVYACLVDLEDETQGARALAVGAANIGVRPTAGAGRSVEVHLLDFAGDLYERRLRVHLVAPRSRGAGGADRPRRRGNAPRLRRSDARTGSRGRLDVAAAPRPG
jgi:riboflavin kinase/FMN adenylyltransferase